MPYDAKAIANELLDLADQQGYKLSPLKIQKLVYYSHGWHLAIQKTPLIDEYVEAWKFGPVIPSLYHEFKTFGSNPIHGRATAFDVIDDEVKIYEPSIGKSDATREEQDFARKVCAKILTTYGKYSGVALSEATHKPGTPWAQIREKYGEMKNQDIPNDIIQAYFESLARKQAA